MTPEVSASITQESGLPAMVGLVLGIGGSALVIVSGPPLLEPLFPSTIPPRLISLALDWAITLGLVWIVRGWEGRSLASLGVRPLSLREVLVALILGLLLALVPNILFVVASRLAGGAPELTIAGLNVPVWLVGLAVVSAAITEEVRFRAFPIEQVAEWTGKAWLGALLAYVPFVVLHVPGWPLIHVVSVVLPMGAVLAAIYLWKRNLLFSIIIHCMIDFPLLVGVIVYRALGPG